MALPDKNYEYKKQDVRFDKSLGPVFYKLLFKSVPLDFRLPLPS